MDYAFTLHSAWTEQAAPSNATYKIDVRSDYDPLIAQLEPALRRPGIQELFERFVYPNFGDAPVASSERTVSYPPVENNAASGTEKTQRPGFMGRLLGGFRRLLGKNSGKNT
jgi:hypothetical protein